MATSKVVAPGESAKMLPPALDLLFLTYNCGKAFVNAGVFAHHLKAAFRENATTLPDVVVLSLQEVAPMSHAFIGDYFLSSYIARFNEAVNLAATQFSASEDAGGSSHDENLISVTPTPDQDTTKQQQQQQQQQQQHPYTLVRSHNVGYTAIILFARDPTRILDLQDAEVGFGAAEMGNKGAVGLRLRYRVAEEAETEVTFVATHLAAMEWNLARRNANWAAIMRGLTFENPELLLQKFRKSQAAALPTTTDSESEPDGGERVHLLHEELEEQHARLQQDLHDISVFKPSSHLFVAGDLNYRISTTSPPPYAAFPSLDPASEHYHPTFFPLDQLTRERLAGRTLHGLTEAEVKFPPTYKYDVLPAAKGGDEPDKPVPWKFAPHRYPSWTDRVLWLDVPAWLRGNGKGKTEAPTMHVRAYDALPLMRSSDHRPVFLRVDVPLISPADMKPPASTNDAEAAATLADPRAKLPVEIDPEAWERRAAARRRELMAGWSMFFWSTKEGALVLTSLLVAGIGGVWFLKST